MTGDITLEDVYRAVPWPSTVDVIKVSGATLKSILEHSVRDYDPNHEDPGGRFLQISGLIVHYDIRNPIGERVISIKVGQPNQSPETLPSVFDEKIYNVSLPSYLITGGDGYKMIPEHLIYHKNTGFLMQDLVTHFVENNSPIKMPISGRIVFKSTTSGQLKSEVTFYYYIMDIVLLMTWLMLS